MLGEQHHRELCSKEKQTPTLQRKQTPVRDTLTSCHSLTWEEALVVTY